MCPYLRQKALTSVWLRCPHIYLVDVSLTSGVHGFMELWHVHFNIFPTKCTAALCKILTGLWWSVDNDQLSWFHLINDLFNGIPIRASFIVYVSNPSSVIDVIIQAYFSEPKRI